MVNFLMPVDYYCIQPHSAPFFLKDLYPPFSSLRCTLRHRHADPETVPEAGFMLFLDLCFVACLENSTLKEFV